jgi:hypothetical protein
MSLVPFFEFLPLLVHEMLGLLQKLQELLLLTITTTTTFIILYLRALGHEASVSVKDGGLLVNSNARNKLGWVFSSSSLVEASESYCTQ